MAVARGQLPFAYKKFLYLIGLKHAITFPFMSNSTATTVTFFFFVSFFFDFKRHFSVPNVAPRARAPSCSPVATPLNFKLNLINWCIPGFCQHFTGNPIFIFDKTLTIIMFIPLTFPLSFYGSILTIIMSIPPAFPVLMPLPKLL